MKQVRQPLGRCKTVGVGVGLNLSYFPLIAFLTSTLHGLATHHFQVRDMFSELFCHALFHKKKCINCSMLYCIPSLCTKCKGRYYSWYLTCGTDLPPLEFRERSWLLQWKKTLRIMGTLPRDASFVVSICDDILWIKYGDDIPAPLKSVGFFLLTSARPWPWESLLAPGEGFLLFMPLTRPSLRT